MPKPLSRARKNRAAWDPAPQLPFQGVVSSSSQVNPQSNYPITATLCPHRSINACRCLGKPTVTDRLPFHIAKHTLIFTVATSTTKQSSKTGSTRNQKPTVFTKRARIGGPTESHRIHLPYRFPGVNLAIYRAQLLLLPELPPPPDAESASLPAEGTTLDLRTSTAIVATPTERGPRTAVTRRPETNFGRWPLLYEKKPRLPQQSRLAGQEKATVRFQVFLRRFFRLHNNEHILCD